MNKKGVMATSLLMLLAAIAVALSSMATPPASAFTSSKINSVSSIEGETRFTCLPGLADNATIKPQMPLMPPMRREMRCSRFRGYSLEVSEEYKEKVLNIVENDADVQKLLNEGYNITGIKPLIKSVVNEDGTVVTKVATAVVMLKKDATGKAMVWVDLEHGKVTKIVSLTLTVIEKH